MKLDSTLDCTRTTLAASPLIDAVAVTDAAVMITITEVWPAVTPCPLTDQLTVVATTARVVTLVEHAADTRTWWYSLVHGMRVTSPPLTATPPG